MGKQREILKMGKFLPALYYLYILKYTYISSLLICVDYLGDIVTFIIKLTYV
jgi:hypothetical protein